jgi:hypothetical protein
VTSFPATDKSFRRIMGWKNLWNPEVTLGRKVSKLGAAQPVTA